MDGVSNETCCSAEIDGETGVLLSRMGGERLFFICNLVLFGGYQMCVWQRKVEGEADVSGAAEGEDSPSRVDLPGQSPPTARRVVRSSNQSPPPN